MIIKIIILLIYIQYVDNTFIKNTQQVSQDYHIEFIRGVSFGDTEDVFLGRISDVTVDALNRVYIGDVNQLTIHVFNPDGTYHTSLGRSGRGPGEFNQLSVNATLQTHSYELYAIDIDSYEAFPHRVHVFSLDDLEFDRTIMIMANNMGEYDELAGYFPNDFYPLDNGTLLVKFNQSAHDFISGQRTIRYFVVDNNGSIVSDQIFEQPGLIYLSYKYRDVDYTVSYYFPFYSKPLFVVSDDLLYAAASKDFLIDVFNLEGDYLHSISHSFDKVPLNRADLLEAREGRVIQQMIREAENLPDTWPALEEMFFDDENRLWVSTIVEDFDIYEWWVLEDTGELITKFEWPRDEPIEVVRNGYMYTRETEEETGLEQIVRYRIEMEEI